MVDLQRRLQLCVNSHTSKNDNIDNIFVVVIYSVYRDLFRYDCQRTTTTLARESCLQLYSNFELVVLITQHGGR